MDSVWQQTVAAPRFDALDHEIKTDVLVIGGGIAGLLCAYLLKQAGVNCVVVEASRICSGVTKNTTAKITVQHGLLYDKLIRTFGADAARLYLQANQAALERYREMCRTIDCDFQEQDAYLYSLRDRKKLEDERKALDRLGCAADFVEQLPLPFSVVGAVRVARQAQFHPLKFAFALAAELNIFENTAVTELSSSGAKTARGQITAEKIIVATHFPFLNLHGSYFLKLYQDRSYVLALEHAPSLDGMYKDENEKGLSFRSYGSLLLLGGGSHRTGKKGGGWKELEADARRFYPNATIAYRWATQDCMTLDGLPYVGQYSARTPNVYVATGFRKWGMTGAMSAAMLLSDLALGKENPYAAVVSPSRTILHPQLAVNALEATVNLLTPTLPRCPHMGCALKYNESEQSWDCPCHGSRFTADGKLIDNPATGPLR